MNAPAVMPDPAASVPSTAERLRLSVSAARKPDAVIAPSAKNQNPSSGLCQTPFVASPFLVSQYEVFKLACPGKEGEP
jgi:hypothetical protein